MITYMMQLIFAMCILASVMAWNDKRWFAAAHEVET